MKDLEDFENFYTSELAPSLLSVENRRLAMKEMRWRTFLVGASIIFAHWVVLYLTTLSYWSLVITLIVTPAGVYYYFRRKYHDEAIPADFKQIAVTQLVAFADDSLSYDPVGYVPFDDFRHSELYPITPDHYTGDDLIKGTIDGYDVTISELFVQIFDQDYKAKEKNNWITTFKGLFMVIDIGEEYPYRTFIFSDDLQRKGGHAARLMQEGNVMYGHYVNPHNLNFSDRFVVYCEDEIQGEGILTERFMEELLQLQDNTGCDVHLSILGKKVYIAIEREADFFEVDTTKSLLDLAYISSFYQDLYYVFNIINDLDVKDYTNTTIKIPSIEIHYTKNSDLWKALNKSRKYKINLFWH